MDVEEWQDLDGQEDLGQVIDMSQVNRDGFESKVKERDGKCVISGCSLSTGRLVCGPGPEAAHVVPQSQWLAFPLRDDPPPKVGHFNTLANNPP